MASTLQAQLAALSGVAGKHPGSAVVPSKQHEQAIGRGVNFNIQQGQIVLNRGIRHRATIIHKDPKEAADVPLATLEENCQDALAALSEILPSLASASLVLCGHDDASNAYIQQVLTRICILLGENDEEVTQNCLHVVEYLLRRYEIHQHLMEDLVWTFLPYHQQLTNLWHRCLLLVDLASHPSYLWLRPYADANRPAPTPRSLCATHVVREIPLLRRLCATVRKTAAEQAMEPEEEATPLRGWSHVLSWTAACLVDGLVQRQQQALSNVESLARILVPAVRQALRAQLEEYCSWGCVVASTMAECMELSSGVLSQWGEALLENETVDPTTSWAALASMLLAGQDPQRVEEESYLPLLQNDQWIGCPLPAKIYNLVTADCVEQLASIYQSLEVTPLVVAVLVRSIRANNVDLAVALLEEDGLATLWKSHSLVASVAAFVVRMYTADVSSAIDLDTGRAILQSLCGRFSSLECENGVAMAAGNAESAYLQPLIDGIVTLVSSLRADEGTDILPPRVALEHPDVEVRRQALEKLVKNADSYHSPDAMDNGETLMETLVRRLSVEPDQKLAEEFAQTVIDADLPLITSDRAEEQSQGILSATYHWMDNDSMSTRLRKIVEKAIHDASEIEESWPSFQQLQEMAVCLVKLTEAAKNTIVLDVLSNSDFLKRLIENFGKPSGIQNTQRDILRQEQCALRLLVALKDPSSGNTSLAPSYLKIFVLMVHSQPNDDADFRKVAKASLDRIIRMLTGSPDLLVDSLGVLADLSGRVYVDVVDPALRRLATCVTDPTGQKVSPLAVVMEAAARSTTPPLAVKNLFGIAKSFLHEDDCPGWVAIVPSLAFLSHSNKGVRESAVEMLRDLWATGKGEDVDFNDTLPICEMVSSDAVSIVQVGVSLPKFLAQCAQNIGTMKTKQSLVQLTIHAIFTTARRIPEPELGAFESARWLAVEAQSGTRDAGCSIFEALEATGEDAFSLSLRWKHAGVLLFDYLMKIERSGEKTKLPRVGVMVARLLKGVTVQGPQVLLSSGRDSGGSRSRSYSIGNMDGAEVIRPYPKDMVESTVIAIETSANFRDILLEHTLESTTWTGSVFPNLEKSQRKRLVESLLTTGSESQAESLIRVAKSLPLTTQDAADLLHNVSVNENNFSYLASLVDVLKANGPNLAGKKGISHVFANLFKTIKKLSSSENSDTDGVEFLLQSSLRAVVVLLSEKPTDLPKKSLPDWVDSILSLLGAPRDKSHPAAHHISNWRGRSVCLEILTTFASLDGKAVVDSVVDLTLQLASNTATFNADEVRSVLPVSVPLMWSNVSSAHRNITSFLKDLLEMIVRQEHAVRHLLLGELVKSMTGATNVDEQYRNLTPGIISSVLVAMRNNEFSEAEWNEMVVVTFEASPIQMQVMSLPFLVEIARQVLGQILESPDDEESSGYMPSCGDIMPLILSSQEGESSKEAASFVFIRGMLSVVSECVILDQVQKLLRKRSTTIAASSLKLWQNLLLIHSTAEAAIASKAETDPNDFESWRMVAALAEGCRESVQANISSNVFVAAVRSLLKESVTVDLRARALRLVSDRVLDLDTGSQERAVFVDFLSDAIQLIQHQNEDIRVKQGALVYIEHTARTLFRPASEEKHDKHSSQKLLHALSLCADVVKATVGTRDDFSELTAGTWHLLASIALATTTIIRVIGIRALPKLGGLLKAFLSLLSYMNTEAETARASEDLSLRPIIQISVLRFIQSSLTAPQAILVHLPALLSESGLFSETLRKTNDSTVAASLKSVDDGLSSKIPARLLIPALVKFICGSDHSPYTLMHAFEALSKSLSHVNATEGGFYRSLVTKAALRAFELKCTPEESTPLINKASDCILGLVLKLSELQFRKMYGDLSEWMRQDPDNRRFAFWSLSEALANELKAIFLPCASLVFDEIAKDLNLFADALSMGSAVEMVHGGRKKRKKSVNLPSNVDLPSLISLIPLLGTVSVILRSDAQFGGKWTREHGRYHSLLEPLSKLLQSRIPDDLYEPSLNTTAFEHVVEDNSRGSVVGCLTSLALASGDEQLWKPLNHAVLEACGNASRSEVRKGGVVCLLSLIRTLGEEYMVLLPECLPILAELLEDENEIVAGLARDAVSTAEDLLGESLEANLR